MAHPSDREQITVAPDFRPRDEQPVWRQDFPIDWPDDHYVERRGFLRFMVLTSAAFVAGHAWILAQRLVRTFTSAPAGVRITSLDRSPSCWTASRRRGAPRDERPSG